MYEILTIYHSFLRWVLLILLLAAIIKSLNGILAKRAFSPADNKISLFLMISAHTQLVVGLLLYFVSPLVKLGATDPTSRFFTMEHSSMMIVAIVFITLARILSKKGKTDAIKFRRLFIFSFIALLIIFAAIPWPFSPISRPWF
jgi:hypothetical protein